MKNKVIAQKELIEFYEHMIRKNSTYLMIHGIRWLDEDIIKGEQLRHKIQSIPDDDWIAVTDRLPEEDGNYLTANKDDTEINWYCNTRERFGRSEMIITHWMPLPLPPNQ